MYSYPGAFFAGGPQPFHGPPMSMSMGYSGAYTSSFSPEGSMLSRGYPGGREHERRYRGSHNPTPARVARHTVPADWIEEFQFRGNDHSGNYRMGTAAQNDMDRRIDSMTAARVARSRGVNGDGGYIPVQRVVDRITQQVESMRGMRNPSRRQLRDLYVTARENDMDLRVFNGLEFDRR
eukprot:RCo016586